MAGLLIAGWGLYMFGWVQGHESGWQFKVVHRQPQIDQQQGLHEKNQRLRRENSRLSRRLTALKRSTGVDQSASVELKEALGEMRARVGHLKKQLAFYRGIVSPKTGGVGVRVQSISVVHAGKPDLYDLKFTLIQPMGYQGDASGEVQVTLRGVRDGKSVRLGWQDLVLEPASGLDFSFEYYQRLGGVFRVPDHIQPVRLILEIDSESGGSIGVTRPYRWSQLTASVH